MPNKITNAQFKNKNMRKELSAGTGDGNPAKDENQQVSPACIKPNVGCCTSVNELIQWYVLNAFNIEGQDGIKYVAIDYEEMQSQLDYFVEKEKTQIIDAFTAGQIDIANTFFAEYNKCGFEYKLSIPENDKEDGEKYFDETFKNNGVPV